MIFGRVCLGDGVLEFKGVVGDVEQLVKTFSSEVQRGDVGGVPGRKWRFDGSLQEKRAMLCGESSGIFAGEDFLGNVSSDVADDAVAAASRLSRCIVGSDAGDRGHVSGGVQGDTRDVGGRVEEAEVCGTPKIGKWRRKNLKKKENRKVREKFTVGADTVVEEVSWRVPQARVVGKTEAQKTLEAKWVVENRLKAFEAERKLELLKMQDVSEVAKLQERKLKAAGERAMVQIEKSHATLAATGNVPGVVPKGGYCTTVVDDLGLSDGSTPTCTISPDSSASMHEYKQCLLDLADTRKELADARKLLSRREKAGRMHREDSVAEFTVNGSEVGLPASLCEVLDKKCGQYEYDGVWDGKHVVRAVHDLHFGFEEGEDMVGMLDSY